MNDIYSTLQEFTHNNKITCQNAHDFAKKCNQSPLQIGRLLDEKNIRVDKCQLGLFGYGPQKKKLAPHINLSPDQQQSIRNAQQKACVSCHDSWKLAKQLNLSRLEMGSACEKLGLRIKPCQLGIF